MNCLPYLFPLIHVCLAFKEARAEIPLARCVMGRHYRILRSSPDYLPQLQTLPGFHLTKEMRPFLQKVKLRDDLIIYEDEVLMFGRATGTNLFKSGMATISVPLDLAKKDREACTFAIKHEAAHLKFNHFIAIPIVVAISTVATAIFASFKTTLIACFFLTYAVNVLTQIAMLKYIECQADDFAIAESSIEELQGARHLLIASAKHQSDKRTTLYSKILIDANGDSRLNVFNPSLSSRIAKIEKALSERKAEVFTDQSRVIRLKQFISERETAYESSIAARGGHIKAHFSALQYLPT